MILDELMDGLGGPDMVAEMTGRRNRYEIDFQRYPILKWLLG